MPLARSEAYDFQPEKLERLSHCDSLRKTSGIGSAGIAPNPEQRIRFSMMIPARLCIYAGTRRWIPAIPVLLVSFRKCNESRAKLWTLDVGR